MIALPAAASARQPMSPTLPSSRSRRVQHRPSRPLPPGTHARSPRGNHAATTRQHCGYGATWQPLQRQGQPEGGGSGQGQSGAGGREWRRTALAASAARSASKCASCASESAARCRITFAQHGIRPATLQHCNTQQCTWQPHVAHPCSVHVACVSGSAAPAGARTHDRTVLDVDGRDRKAFAYAYACPQAHCATV